VRPPVRHLVPTRLNALGDAEKELLRHVATCRFCRHFTAGYLESAVATPASSTNSADAAARVLDELQASSDLTAKLDAIEQEQRDAWSLVEQLRDHPEAWGVASLDSRYANPSVVWRLLAVAEDLAPQDSVSILQLALEIARTLTVLYPKSSLHRQLVVECRCASTQRLLDLTNRPAAHQELQRAAAILTPDLDYARALYCQTLARLRREQGRHEEALALASRAVSLFEGLGDAELGQASNELGWTLLLAGEPSEALEIFLRARDLTRSVPAASVSTCLGLALALIDIKNPRAVDPLLADADVAIDQVSEPVTRLRLRCLEVGVDELVGDLPAQRLCLDQQDLIAWRYESIRLVRIVFPPESQP
jgi:tetratricopeptide (TPR) repeat protein